MGTESRSVEEGRQIGKRVKLQRNPQKLLSVMDIFNNLLIVMVSWIYAHTNRSIYKTYHGSTLYMLLLVWQ